MGGIGIEGADLRFPRVDLAFPLLGIVRVGVFLLTVGIVQLQRVAPTDAREIAIASGVAVFAAIVALVVLTAIAARRGLARGPRAHTPSPAN